MGPKCGSYISCNKDFTRFEFGLSPEAYYGLQDLEKAVFAGCLGMYLLEQIGSNEWGKTVGLMVVLKGKLGEEFNEISEHKLSEILPVIGVDSYDYIPEILVKYQQ
ncbi:MAG: hypothetical protein F6K40_02180 [Okeania sp. SIO3I5]|uniref:hypothetical protein n=1 Tax=Okeania sp. SIO3I5 TaxID=2607805 RepID=UPI0013BE1DE1|nr:hypothetical protein [Okeania sp. SIO3I5]NEQ35180.1 hypothetical protein [Okeania sp. SIO3I5]